MMNANNNKSASDIVTSEQRNGPRPLNNTTAHTELKLN